MANVKRCDRCERIYEPDKYESGLFVREVEGETGYIMRQFDLCEECKVQLRWFVDGGNIEPAHSRFVIETCGDA